MSSSFFFFSLLAPTVKHRSPIIFVTFQFSLLLCKTLHISQKGAKTINSSCQTGINLQVLYIDISILLLLLRDASGTFAMALPVSYHTHCFVYKHVFFMISTIFEVLNYGRIFNGGFFVCLGGEETYLNVVNSKKDGTAQF